MIIDATDLLLGRMASFIAKKALLGETIEIVNCEKAAISGNRQFQIEKYRRKRTLGQPTRGPIFYRRPDLFVRKSIRGMLNYKSGKGSKAFEKIKCHLGIPKSLEGKKFETIHEANLAKLPYTKYVRVGDICRSMGGVKYGS